MKLQRDWITPITMGAFGVLAVTGVLMFFHAKTPAIEGVHEWLSWLLLISVAGHAAVNWTGLRRHLAGWRARAALGVGGAALVAALLPIGPSGGKPPFVVPMQALAEAPLPVLAQVAKVSTEQVRERLRGAGLAPVSDADTVRSLAGKDLGSQMRALSAVMKSPGG